MRSLNDYLFTTIIFYEWNFVPLDVRPTLEEEAPPQPANVLDPV